MWRPCWPTRERRAARPSCRIDAVRVTADGQGPALVSLIRLGIEDSGATRSAAVGDIVSVRLAETATSGFRWTVDYVDDHVLRPAGDAVALDAADDRGAPGERTLQFEVVGHGLGDLRLKRWRDWQGDDSVVERFAVTVDARPASLRLTRPGSRAAARAIELSPFRHAACACP